MTNGVGAEIIGEFPFVLRVSKHEFLFFSTLLGDTGHFDIERLKIFGHRHPKQSPVGGSKCNFFTESDLETKRRGEMNGIIPSKWTALDQVAGQE